MKSITECKPRSRVVHEAFPSTDRVPVSPATSFEFVDHSRRRERLFKLAILAATCLAIARHHGHCAARAVSSRPRSPRRQPGHCGTHLVSPPREPRSTKRGRASGSRESTIRDGHCQKSTTMPAPDVQRLMRYAGLDPEHGLLRWGNYDRTMLLPSKVFAADDNGTFLPFAALRRFDLAQANISPEWCADVLSRSRRAEIDRGNTRNRGDPRRNVEAVHKFLGPAQDRSRISMHRCAALFSATRSCRGCLSVTVTRRRNACGAFSKSDSKTKVSILNTGHLGLFAGAILLLVSRVCRSLSSPLRRRERLRQ